MNDWKQQMKTRLTPVAEIFLGKGGLERKPLLRPVQPRPIAQMMKDLRALDESVWAEYAFKTNVSEGNVNEDTVIQTVDYGNICSSK